MIINQPIVVYFEGADGVGKSTVIREVAEKLREDGFTVSLTSQPRSCKLGEIVYDLHHKYSEMPLHGFARQLLHVASHIQGYHEMERDPAHILLYDRSFISSMAYGFAYPQTPETREFEVRAIFDIETFMLPRRLKPTHIFYFSNPTHEPGDAVFENQKKIRDGYSYVLHSDYFRDYLQPGTKHAIACYAMNNQKGKQEETVKTILELLQL